MTTAKAFAANSAKSPLAAASINRREPGANDVEFDIAYCGVCHSDLHTARNEWEAWPTVYPCVPGHEIVGRVTKVGPQVKGFKPGDLAAVGCMVDACKDCRNCNAGLEQYCERGMVLTYNSPDAHAPGKMTYGGYSKNITVHERFVLRLNPKAN